MKILVLNSGSSSLKYQVIDMETEEMLAKGYFERIGQSNSFLTHKVHGQKHKFEHYAKNHEQAIEFVISRLVNPHYGVLKDLSELGGIGHRVVHGGEKFSDPVLITEDVIKYFLGRFPESAMPGQVGNFAVAGHRVSDYTDAFINLYKVKVGDEVIVTTKDGRYTYEVDNSFIVDPDQVEVLEEADYEKMTLVTCTIGSKRRVIVTGKLIGKEDL